MIKYLINASFNFLTAAALLLHLKMPNSILTARCKSPNKCDAFFESSIVPAHPNRWPLLFLQTQQL